MQKETTGTTTTATTTTTDVEQTMTPSEQVKPLSPGKKSNQETLPQTGEEMATMVTIIGIVIIASVIGFRYALVQKIKLKK